MDIFSEGEADDSVYSKERQWESLSAPPLLTGLRGLGFDAIKTKKFEESALGTALDSLNIAFGRLDVVIILASLAVVVGWKVQTIIRVAILMLGLGSAEFSANSAQWRASPCRLFGPGRDFPCLLQPLFPVDLSWRCPVIGRIPARDSLAKGSGARVRVKKGRQCSSASSRQSFGRQVQFSRFIRARNKIPTRRDIP